jgi:transposase
MLTSAIRNDSPRFRTLLSRVQGRIGDVCGDTAYSCRENARRVASRGGTPYLMPKENATSRARGCQPWKDMMTYRERHPIRFENRYHRRSNAESINSSLKGKYGESLYSRRWHTQKREAGLKVVAYNMRQLIRYRIRTGA